MRQRTEPMDGWHFGDQWSHQCLGHHPGYPFAQTHAEVRLET
jgi:hypothetical protein